MQNHSGLHKSKPQPRANPKMLYSGKSDNFHSPTQHSHLFPPNNQNYNSRVKVRQELSSTNLMVMDSLSSHFGPTPQIQLAQRDVNDNNGTKR